MKKVEIYVLTHKDFDETYDVSLYKPLLNGSMYHDDDFGFLRDDVGDNISNLNNKFSELTGEYWAWKNSDADIYGFCHYRRWFVKKFNFKKITKENIIEDLKEHDIILPKRLNLGKSCYEAIKYTNEHFPDYDANLSEYKMIEDILKEYFPDYYGYYVDVMNNKHLFAYNMFICSKELADNYFEWLFMVFNILEPKIDFSTYSDNPRIYGFLSERLLTTFVLRNNLKVKEYDVLYNEAKVPIMPMIYARFPLLAKYGAICENFLKKQFMDK